MKWMEAKVNGVEVLINLSNVNYVEKGPEGSTFIRMRGDVIKIDMSYDTVLKAVEDLYHD